MGKPIVCRDSIYSPGSDRRQRLICVLLASAWPSILSELDADWQRDAASDWLVEQPHYTHVHAPRLRATGARVTGLPQDEGLTASGFSRPVPVRVHYLFQAVAAARASSEHDRR